MLLNKKFPIIAGVIIVSIIAVTLIITQDTDNIESSLNEEGYTLVDLSTKKEGPNWEKLEFGSIFNVYGQDVQIQDEKQTDVPIIFELNPENQELYNELGYDEKKKTIVILPAFTASAYTEPGFYNYYREECDQSCLTVPLKAQLVPESSVVGAQTLAMLGYPITTDFYVSQNPEILNQYDKVIVLHNEYVTRAEFDAITNHPEVIYLYPNALYAEVQLNSDNTISLIRGHGYPDPEISNGFDWKFDNTHPYEFDTKCEDWQFYVIDNGIMLNCYPVNIIHTNIDLLKKIKN